ncbi:hypothetical protein HOU35_gp044 [Acinetobacter phage vB_AbaM_B09_Aci05]|uniref:Uncharacterized protein n=1 Tax=Acinetobacter phage vB_AbaM_B09_Aci05 TaxID=2315458 RepID=A0A386KC41_9CAUD|nr:hypothetical protein HOU35_gp044 [Acinetobacter phage vB_AbaM_B09_Aci05]AYD82332.1 hypothetical protein Aci05_133 [Acinetobacter phage vB_AbaM_B09_Aci05]
MEENSKRFGMGLSLSKGPLSAEENYSERIRRSRERLRDSVAASDEYMMWRSDGRGAQAINAFSTKVFSQELNIRATADAVTELQRDMTGGPAPIPHRNRYKAILADKPYVMYLQGCKYVVNPKFMPYNDLSCIDDLSLAAVLRIYDKYTNIKLQDYESIVPVKLEVLDRIILVWDKRADVDKFDIFKQVMEFSDDDFDTYAKRRGWRVHRDPYKKLLTLSKPDPVRVHVGFPRKSRMIMPEEINGWEDDVEEDIDECWEFENEGSLEEVMVERSRIDRIPPSLERGDNIDMSMAEAMKAKRDGRFDVRMMTDGTMVKVGEPKLSMSEEIEQRLIEKYLT